MKDKNLVNKVLTALILLVLFAIPVVGIITTPRSGWLVSERRQFQPLPTELDATFFPKFSDYLKDHLLQRQKVLDLTYPSYLKHFRMYDLDPNSFTIKGKDGFWMLGNQHEKVGMQFCTPMLEYLDEAMGVYDRIKHEVNFVQEQTGLPSKLFIVPDKHEVYSELLPPYKQMGKVRFFDHFLQYANENGLDVYDALPAVMAAKQKINYPLWYRRDSHWNAIGAYAGYAGFMQSLSGNPVDASFLPIEFKRVGDTINYDLGGSFEVTDNFIPKSTSPLKIEMHATTYQPGNYILSDFSSTFEGLRYFTPVFINESAPYDYTVLIIGDSTTDASISYFAATFKKVILTEYYSPALEDYVALAKHYKADFVVWQIVERIVSFGKVHRRVVEP